MRDKPELERLILQGLDSGEGSPLTDEQWQAIRQEVNKRLAGREPKSVPSE
jgi:hypothetical protein